MKSIEKLRESSRLDDDKWTLETGEVVRMYGTEPSDPNAVNWGERWREIADEIEAEIAERFMELPEGWTGEQAADVLAYWPKWDDGSPCMFGDEFTCYPKYDGKKKYETLDRLSIFSPNHVWDRGSNDEKPHSGGYYEWNYMRPGGDGCEEYRPTKRKPRTLEDVLVDMLEAAVGYSDAHTDVALVSVESYADEIRELLGSDGEC